MGATVRPWMERGLVEWTLKVSTHDDRDITVEMSQSRNSDGGVFAIVAMYGSALLWQPAIGGLPEQVIVTPEAWQRLVNAIRRGPRGWR